MPKRLRRRRTESAQGTRPSPLRRGLKFVPSASVSASVSVTNLEPVSEPDPVLQVEEIAGDTLEEET